MKKLIDKSEKIETFENDGLKEKIIITKIYNDGSEEIEINTSDNRKILIHKLNEKYHNENGPAHIQYYNNILETEVYYINGLIHNDIDSASRIYHPNLEIKEEYYFIHDCIHNENGPAHILKDNFGDIQKQEFFIDDVNLTENYNINSVEELKKYIKTKIMR